MVQISHTRDACHISRKEEGAACGEGLRGANRGTLCIRGFDRETILNGEGIYVILYIRDFLKMRISGS